MHAGRIPCLDPLFSCRNGPSDSSIVKQLKTQPFSLLPKISDLGTSMGRNGSKDEITKKTMRSRLDIKEKLILYNLIIKNI